MLFPQHSGDLTAYNSLLYGFDTHVLLCFRKKSDFLFYFVLFTQYNAFLLRFMLKKMVFCVVCVSCIVYHACVCVFYQIYNHCFI